MDASWVSSASLICAPLCSTMLPKGTCTPDTCSASQSARSHPPLPPHVLTRVVKVSELARSVSSEAMGRINRIKAELHSAKEEALKARRRARHAGDQVGAG